MSFHLKNFTKRARQLERVVNEVVVSFTQPYAKTVRNLARLEQKASINFQYLPDESKQPFLIEVQKIAALSGIRMTLCTQPNQVTEHLPGAACIDKDRIAAPGGENINPKLQGNREECLCIASRDIGMYGTCAHGCVYCYAVKNAKKAKAALKTYKRGMAVTS